MIFTGTLRAFVSEALGEEEGKRYLHLARVLLAKAIVRAEAAGLDVFCSWHTFDGVTIRVGRMGGLYLADILPAPVSEETTQEQSTATLWPLGGLLCDSYLEVKELEYAPEAKVHLTVNDRYIPTEKSLARLDSTHAALAAWIETNTLTAPAEQLAAVALREEYTHHGEAPYKLATPYLAVPVPEKWSHLYNNPVELPPDAEVPPKVYAQHRLIKPTMYSGRMRIVAQLLMGFGTQNQPAAEILKTIGGPEEDYPHDDPAFPRPPLGSCNYWFHWVKTHGIYVTEKGRYYLIEIGQDGVYALRLPVAGPSLGVPEEAKEYLHAMPLGYSFPRRGLTKEEIAKGRKEDPFDAALRQGWVKRLIDREQLADFYERLRPTYAECGWAFSLSGRKADNVGWRILAKMPYDYPVFEHWSIELYGGDGDEENPFDYAHCGAGFDHSIETLNGMVRKVGGGNALLLSQNVQPFKIPSVDPDTGVPCVTSFDMLPQGWPTSGPPGPAYMKAMSTYPVSDTVVHVFYDDEELVWVRFFNPQNTAKVESDSWDDRLDERDPHQCMILGGYTWGDYSRPTTLPMGFYSNRVDPRQTADESRTDMQSQGKKTWESPYCGVQYSFPYPPFGYGYSQSYGENEWYNDWYTSWVTYPGSPWTAKRHGFHVHVTGTRVIGQSYSYSCAVPLTDREAVFLCQRHFQEVTQKIDWQYAAVVMQYVYYTYPAWIPDYSLGIDHHIIPVGFAPWQLRSDTVKYLAYGYYPTEDNYTKEKLQAPQTQLAIQGGDLEFLTDTWDRTQPVHQVEDYTIHTLCSQQDGGYPLSLRGTVGSHFLWEWKLPNEDGSLPCAHLWCTRSVLGTEGAKQNIYLHGAMGYSGVFEWLLTEEERVSRHRQMTFVGVT